MLPSPSFSLLPRFFLASCCCELRVQRIPTEETVAGGWTWCGSSLPWAFLPVAGSFVPTLLTPHTDCGFWQEEAQWVCRGRWLWPPLACDFSVLFTLPPGMASAEKEGQWEWVLRGLTFWLKHRGSEARGEISAAPSPSLRSLPYMQREENLAWKGTGVCCFGPAWVFGGCSETYGSLDGSAVANAESQKGKNFVTTLNRMSGLNERLWNQLQIWK